MSIPTPPNGMVSNTELILRKILGEDVTPLPPNSRVEFYLTQVEEYIEKLATGATRPIGETTTPLTDGATTNPITIDGESYTAQVNDLVFFQNKEFLFTANGWREVGDITNLNADMIDDSNTTNKFATQAELDQIGTNETNILLKANTADIFGASDKPVGLGNNPVKNNTDYIWFQYSEPIRGNRIRFRAKTGTTNFYKVNYVEGASSATYELLSTVENTVAEDGNIKSVDIDDVEFSENEYLGVNGSFFFISSPTLNYYSRNITIATGAISVKGNQYLDFAIDNSNCIDVKLNDNIAKCDMLDAEVAEIEGSYLFDKTIRKNGEVVLYNHKFTETDAEWAGTQTFDSYGMTVTSRVYLERAYAVSDRTAKFVCKFNSDSIAYFEVVGSDGSSVNTRIIVNIANQTVQLSGKTAVACSFLNSTDEFMITLTKNYEDLRVSVTDIYTGESLNFEYTMSGTGGAGAGAVETDKAVSVPMQHVYYALSAGASSFSVSKMIIVSSKCDLLIYGDSITEGEAYWPHDMFDKHWVQLLIRQMSGKALASGRSGGHFGDIYPRMQNEIPYIKPKYVMITTGTNGATSVQYYTTMVQYIKSQGCIPILNHIPCYDNDGDTTGFRAVNENIDTVRSAEEVTGVDFDLATSTAHDGQDVDTTAMWYEDYSSTSGKHYYYHHPNVKGCAAMFQRILIDVPEIFDI